MIEISLIGAGYVGLVTALCFVERGLNVILVDSNQSRLETIDRGELPFYETGLDELMRKAHVSGRFRCTPNVKEAVLETEISFITVGTPSSESGQIDLSFVIKCAKELGSALEKKEEYHVVAVKSTVVPGTTNGVIKKTLEAVSGKLAGKEFGLCMNPEFLREGDAVNDTYYPDRVVIGGVDDRSVDTLERFFRNFYGAKCPPILKTTPSNAEMIKYASNAFLAAKVSLINEIANICELTPGLDVNVVAKGVGFDKRIGDRFLLSLIHI